MTSDAPIPTADRPEPRVEVHPDAATLASAVAGELLGRLADAQRAGHRPHVVLTGGTIAREVHRAVARLAGSADVDWDGVELWWGDERFVARGAEDRNATDAWQDLLGPVGAGAVHEVPATDDVADVGAAAETYGAELADRGPDRFEVVMLGVGPDGHVASLFPGFEALAVDDRAVVAVSGSPKPPPERVSLTFPALNRARSVWLLVSGEGKAEAVAAALAADGSVTHTPARGVRGEEETVWFLDSDAASRV